jgi:hypothetical protein
MKKLKRILSKEDERAPKIKQGIYQVGSLSKLKLDYNTGPSKWQTTFFLALKRKKVK